MSSLQAPFRSPGRSHVSIRLSALGRTPTVCSSTPRCGQRTFEQWPAVRRYAGLIEQAAARWDEVAAELDRATPELDELAGKLLEGWLALVTDKGAIGERRSLVAV